MAGPADPPELDDQDQSELFDEGNTNIDELRFGAADREQFEDLPDVYDATSAVGDDDDDEAAIGDEMDDDEIIAAETLSDQDSADLEDDDLFSRNAEGYRRQVQASGLPEEDGADDIDEANEDEVGLVYAGDLNNVMGAGSSARDMESDELSDEDLEDLDYKEPTAVKPEQKTFDSRRDKAGKGDQADRRIAEAREEHSDTNAHQEELLDEGVEETFPASDPVSVKRIT